MTPITIGSLVDLGFTSTDHHRWYKYIDGYTAISCKFEPKYEMWQWQLEEHRDHLNWEDKFFWLPKTCQPQCTIDLHVLLSVLSGKVVP